jgi:hypothetical protein
MAAEVERTLVLAGVLRIPGLLPAGDWQEQTSAAATIAVPSVSSPS